MGDRLMVGQRTLTPPVLVRIQLPQPMFSISHVRAVGCVRGYVGPMSAPERKTGSLAAARGG
jgi:hypothetical protein